MQRAMAEGAKWKPLAMLLLCFPLLALAQPGPPAAGARGDDRCAVVAAACQQSKGMQAASSSSGGLLEPIALVGEAVLTRQSGLFEGYRRIGNYPGCVREPDAHHAVFT